jgi:hypothetical protein
VLMSVRTNRTPGRDRSVRREQGQHLAGDGKLERAGEGDGRRGEGKEASSLRRPKLYGPVQYRLNARTDKAGECWLWTGDTNRSGYGRLEINRKKIQTHRLAWELANGMIPAGMLICHRCDNRLCVKPDHLFLGTIADNNRDMTQKKRLKVPGRGRRRLDRSEVYRVRSAQTEGAVAVAERFGITAQAVRRIWSGRTHSRWLADVSREEAAR